MDLSKQLSQTGHLKNSGPFRKMITGIVLFLTICLIAVIGYMSAGWKLDDSIYMVIITIFGVGYGEVQPIQSPGLRALTITVIIAGYGAVIYTVGGFMQMVIDGEINKALGARKMVKDISQLKNHTIICGIGRMGTILVRDLHEAEKPFVIIDSDENKLKPAKDCGYLTINGDASDEHILEQAGIKHASVLATVLSEDATNVFVTITAREMNPDLMIIARGENPRTEKKLLGCGANRVVLPTAIGANKIAHLIIRPTAEDILENLSNQGNLNEELGQIGIHFQELEISNDSELINHSLNEIKIKSEKGLLIVGFRRVNGETILDLNSNTKLMKNDKLIVLVNTNDPVNPLSKLTTGKKIISYRGVVSEVNQ